MTDKNPSGQDANEGKGKLPPRSGDWHSGLKREKPDSYRATAPNTVSDFVAGRGAAESDDWDPVDEPERREFVGVFSGTPAVDDDAPPEKPPATRRVTEDFYHRRTRVADLLIALILALAAFAAVFTTYRGFGHSWDEALYLMPSERAAAWMVGVINSGDDLMLQRDAVDRHWGTVLDGNDPLHPEVAPVPKLLIGAGLTYLKPMFNLDPMVAMRVPNAILFALTIALLYLLGTREYGRIGGFAAALFYLLMPRVFGHAHIAASETPLAFLTVLTVYCFLVGNRFWPFAAFTGVAFGLAAVTKITALILPVPLMLWGQLYKRRDYASNVFAMAFIAPVVMLAVWPWLWYDGLQRFFDYLMFYTRHQPTAVFYMNRIWGYGSPVAPFYYPLHIAALSVPIWVLVFLAFGLQGALFATIRRPATIRFVLMAVVWIGLSMIPGVPKYDGERLFFPAFAFVALIAAGGFSAFFVGIRKWRQRRMGENAKSETGYMGALALAVITAYGAADLYFTHPNELNYYNWLVGRAKGAYAQGFETSYWGEAVNEDVAGYLNKTLKPGDKVKTLALNELVFDNLRRWGKLPEKVDFSPDRPPYDYVILQVRQGFMKRPERQIFYGNKEAALATFGPEGVPKIVVYNGAMLANVFPAPEGADEETTAVESAGTTQTLATDADTTVGEVATTGSAEITAVDTLTTTADAAELETTQTAPAVLDLLTGDEGLEASEATTASEEMTTAPPDLATETTVPLELAIEETTVTDGETTTRQVFDALVVPGDAATSAPRIYEGDLPSTAPVEQGLDAEPGTQ